jgi:hypothetical protein
MERNHAKRVISSIAGEPSGDIDPNERWVEELGNRVMWR